MIQSDPRTRRGKDASAPPIVLRRRVSNRTRYPRTPDGRYFVAKGRLWRTTNPNLPDAERDRLTKDLMRARADVARHKSDPAKLKDARRRVHAAKVALGERGPAWWDDDGTEDVLRFAPWNTRYRSWWEELPEADRERGLA